MTRKRIVALLSIAIVVLLALPRPAGAHRNDESYLYLDVGDSSLSGRVEMPYPDMREVLGLELTGSAEEILAEVEENLDLLQAYALENTAIGADGAEWTLEFDGAELLTDASSGPNGFGYAVLPFTVALPTPNVPQNIEVTFTPFLDEIPDRTNITLIANDWQRGVFDEEANELVFHTSASPTGEIDLGDSSQWQNFRGSIDLGVDHIKTGPDHVFFILVLLLPAVLMLVGMTWWPSPSFGFSLLRIVLVATMFTIAHSITFTLAGLDYLPLPPSKLVETIIALSIAAAALHNIKPVFGHREWLIAFVFGLFHGMGFAGLVESLDIDQTTQLVSLLGRNVGIEIAQLVIIAITFPMLFILRRTRIYMPFFYAFSALLAFISLVWVVERVFEQDYRINRAIDIAVEWPRAFWVMMVLTGIAALYRWWEGSQGVLRPVGPRATRGWRSLAGAAEPEPVATEDEKVEESVG